MKALEDYMFTLQGKDADRLGIRTDALMVIHQGAVFYERYARGYTDETPHLAWSVSKTVTQFDDRDASALELNTFFRLAIAITGDQ